MLRILVIEDDEFVRDAVRRMCEWLGHRVAEAPEGRAALRMEDADPADVILTDIYMPGMEGVETIREIRRRRPEAKVIAMSGGGGGLGPSDSLRMAQILGAQRTLLKPFDREELRVALEKVLEA